MSLFRRPVRRMQPRAALGEREESPEERPSAPPPSARPTRPTLLSFMDEVDETDVFRVKKSAQSKKLQKQKKLLKPKTNGCAAEVQDDSRYAKKAEELPRPIRDEPQEKSRSIEGIILSGRAALTAGATGDVSDSEGEGSDEDRTDIRFKPIFRAPNDSVKALLDRGDIPDAATIHAARKKRQQAREIGEFIPLQNSSESKANHHSMSTIGIGRRGGRLVREDGEGDGSDEDPDRIDVRGVAPETSKKEQIQLAKEEGPGSDIDSETEEWETQQIRKAVTQNQIIAVQQETYYGGPTYVMPAPIQYQEAEVNPFTIASSAIKAVSITSEHLKSLSLTEGEVFTPHQLTEALKQRLALLHDVRRKKDDEMTEMNNELARLRETCQNCLKKSPLNAQRYEFYQKLRGYLTDLIECLDEKMPTLNALEARAMTLHKRKASFLCERRRSDVRDQAHDVLQNGPSAKKELDNEERRRRCAEREGRRLRRRRAREQSAAAGVPIIHREGDSSDDEVPQSEVAAYDSTQEQILAEANQFFEDTLEEFSSLASVLSHLENWKHKDFSSYVDAYVSLCLPRLAGPFLRIKLLLWNPIVDETAPDWDKMQWYRGLMLYGLQENADRPESEDTLSSDPDISLIPNIVQKVILPKITELVDGTWDPLSGAQSRRLALLLKKASTIPGVTPNSRSILEMAKTVISRIKNSLQHDIFIPILPKSLVDSGPRSSCAFLKRQIAMGVRLLNNLVSFYGIIADETLIPLALEALLQKYLISGIRCAPPTYGADICLAIASSLPKSWVEQERTKGPLQQFITCCQDILSNLSDNILHLKAIEQIRSALAILTGQNSRKD